MEVFEYLSYKSFVNDRVKAMPKAGHGQFSKIAKYIGVNPVVVTQVLKGSRDFSEEQALKLASFLGLQPLETEFFIRLLAFEKAGTHELKAFHRQALNSLKQQASTVKHKVAKHQELDDATRSVFYSDWSYSAVRLLTSIEKFDSADAIAEHLDLGRARVNEIVEFLVSVGLCRINSKGKLELGVVATHTDARSRFANSHRRNWRLKGLEGLNNAAPDELFYSGPCTLSVRDFEIVKKEMLEVIAKLTKLVPDTEPEVLACVNIDWFKV